MSGNPRFCRAIIVTGKQFAKRGIQWRVHDAKKAGLHPLAALGAQTTSFSPSFVSQSRYEGGGGGFGFLHRGTLRTTPRKS